MGKKMKSYQNFLYTLNSRQLALKKKKKYTLYCFQIQSQIKTPLKKESNEFQKVLQSGIERYRKNQCLKTKLGKLKA